MQVLPLFSCKIEKLGHGLGTRLHTVVVQLTRLGNDIYHQTTSSILHLFATTHSYMCIYNTSCVLLLLSLIYSCQHSFTLACYSELACLAYEHSNTTILMHIPLCSQYWHIASRVGTLVLLLCRLLNHLHVGKNT